jgi:hypothetical protein
VGERIVAVVVGTLIGAVVVFLGLLMVGLRWYVGRKSGQTYETPIDIIETTTGLLIALPYGSGADWTRNVLGAGAATLLTQGERVAVDRPTIVAVSDVEGLLPRRTMRMLRLFGVSACLHLEKS